MSRIKLRTPVTIATIVSLLVLAVALVFLARGVRDQSDSWERVVHTREVLEQVQSTLTLTSEAEAAQRGFLLTGNEAFVATYRQSRAAVLPQIRELRELTRENPRQQSALPPFEDDVRLRMDMLERVMQERRAGKVPDTAMLESGRLLKQRILAHARGIGAEEQRLLLERQAKAEKGRRNLVMAAAATSAVSVFLIVLLWIISSRDAVRLRSERARLDATLRSMSEGVIATDLEGNVGLMNPVAEAMTGTTEGRAIGKQLAGFLRFRDGASNEPLGLAAAIGGGSAPVLLSGDGREHVVELSAAAIHPSGGGASGTVLVFRDVTERRARDRLLAESEANNRYTIELNPQIPWKATADGRINDVSDRWIALTGQTRDAVFRDGWAGVVHADDLPSMSAAWLHSVASGEPYDAEHRIHAAGGQLRWMRSRANPRFDETGAIMAWYGFTEDIHARKESELALVRREIELNGRLAQIEAIYRAVPVGLGFVDAGLRLVELNDALAEAAGRPKHASIGMPPSQVLPVPLGERVDAVFQQVLRERRQVSGVEFCSAVPGTPGEQRDWLASFYPVLDESQVQGIVVALLEVTQIKAAQRELIEANRLLEQRVEERTAQIADVNAELRAFAHTVAHDLRAPLRNVEGFATALLEDEAARMSEDGKLFAGRIVAAVVRMDQLITDLLAYSRLSRTGTRLERVDVNLIMKNVLRDLEAQIGDSAARLVVAPGLPAVRASAAILVQILDNLVSNAIKFVAPGVVPHIEIKGAREGLAARLWITDNGIGIAPEHREHVFGVFERLHGHERYPGTGIGLAIVKKGLERMDGSVRIIGGEQGGTTFELTMPAAD